MMERVSDKVLEGIINDQGNIIAGSWNEIHYLLVELRARRKAEKEHGHTDHSASEKDGAVLPIPCTKGYEKWTVKDYFQKINEEMDEFKNSFCVDLDCPADRVCYFWYDDSIADEAADTITAITSMLEAIGIDEQQRQAAQRRVNERNERRGRI